MLLYCIVLMVIENTYFQDLRSQTADHQIPTVELLPLVEKHWIGLLFG
jgi:hypothetical protein